MTPDKLILLGSKAGVEVVLPLSVVMVFVLNPPTVLALACRKFSIEGLKLSPLAQGMLGSAHSAVGQRKGCILIQKGGVLLVYLEEKSYPRVVR